MSSRVFKLLNASERGAIAASAGEAFARWWRGWLAQPVPAASVGCGPAGERGSLRHTSDWMCFSTSAGTLWLAEAGNATQRLCGALAGSAADVAAPGAQTLASALVQAGIDELVELLVGESARVSDAAPPPALWQHGSGAAWVSLPLPGGEVVALLDSGLVNEKLAPLQRPERRRPALNSPRSCIGGQRVDVRLWLGSAEIDLGTFRTLAVNDVLVLDSRTDHPLKITVAGRTAAPCAVLGCSQERKAMRLTVHSPND